MPPYFTLDIGDTIDSWAGAFASLIFVIDNSRQDEISRFIINYKFEAMKATLISLWWLIWQYHWLIDGTTSNLFRFRKDDREISVQNIYVLDRCIFFWEEEVVVGKNKSDRVDWLAQMKWTRNRRKMTDPGPIISKDRHLMFCYQQGYNTYQ